MFYFHVWRKKTQKNVLENAGDLVATLKQIRINICPAIKTGTKQQSQRNKLFDCCSSKDHCHSAPLINSQSMRLFIRTLFCNSVIDHLSIICEYTSDFSRDFEFSLYQCDPGIIFFSFSSTLLCPTEDYLTLAAQKSLPRWVINPTYLY